MTYRLLKLSYSGADLPVWAVGKTTPADTSAGSCTRCFAPAQFAPLPRILTVPFT